MNTLILRVLNCGGFLSEDRCEDLTTCGTKEEICQGENVGRRGRTGP